jgi:GDPmannose 4,6-dehydratase
LAIEAIEFAVSNEIPIIFPSSSEVFSRKNEVVDEMTPHEPHTASGFAKSKSSELIHFYCQKGLLRGSVITMFNHESPMRPDSYLSKTIANQVMAACQSRGNAIRLNSLSVAKGFSWAPETVAFLAAPKVWESNQDFVLGSGQVTSVRPSAGCR